MLGDVAERGLGAGAPRRSVKADQEALGEDRPDLGLRSNQPGSSGGAVTFSRCLCSSEGCGRS